MKIKKKSVSFTVLKLNSLCVMLRRVSAQHRWISLDETVELITENRATPES